MIIIQFVIHAIIVHEITWMSLFFFFFSPFTFHFISHTRPSSQSFSYVLLFSFSFKRIPRTILGVRIIIYVYSYIYIYVYNVRIQYACVCCGMHVKIGKSVFFSFCVYFVYFDKVKQNIIILHGHHLASCRGS